MTHQKFKFSIRQHVIYFQLNEKNQLVNLTMKIQTIYVIVPQLQYHKVGKQERIQLLVQFRQVVEPLLGMKIENVEQMRLRTERPQYRLEFCLDNSAYQFQKEPISHETGIYRVRPRIFKKKSPNYENRICFIIKVIYS